MQWYDRQNTFEAVSDYLRRNATSLGDEIFFCLISLSDDSRKLKTMIM